MKHPAPASSAKPTAPPPVPRHPPDVERLVKAIGGTKAPDFHDLCNTLGLSPAKTEETIKRAIALGVHVHVEHNHVGIRANYGMFQVHRLHLPPLAGDRVQVGVISDTHFGSAHCLNDAIRDFVLKAYKQGVRDILHPGDFLDGMYKHDAPGSQRSVSIDGQAKEALDTLPHLPGLRYHCITGNHDETFTKACGVSVGHYLMNFFLGAGRHDIRFYGDRGATLELHGTRIELWHPCQGKSYSIEHPMRRHLEKIPGVVMPHLIVIGHWHATCAIRPRGIRTIACPTFQSGAGSYGKALGGAPDMGGLILSWNMSEDGTMRSFIMQDEMYYESDVIQVAEGVR